MLLTLRLPLPDLKETMQNAVHYTANVRRFLPKMAALLRLFGLTSLMRNQARYPPATRFQVTGIWMATAVLNAGGSPPNYWR